MTISEEAALWSASRQAAAIRAGEFGGQELLVSRIERLNRELNTVVTLDLQTAREAADRADGMTSGGDFAGPLHEVPITIKDALETAGMRSTGGATELKDNILQTGGTVLIRIMGRPFNVVTSATFSGMGLVQFFQPDIGSLAQLFADTQVDRDTALIEVALRFSPWFVAVCLVGIGIYLAAESPKQLSWPALRSADTSLTVGVVDVMVDAQRDKSRT